MSVHQKALDKAKIQLMARPDSAFFTSVCFSMKHIWDDSIPTACTDGLTIRYSTQFFMSLSPAEQLFLILHETLHVALCHMTRVGSRNWRKFNIAADYAINFILVKSGYTMPKGGLYDAQYGGMSAEEIYDLLPEDPKMDLPMEDIQGPGMDGSGGTPVDTAAATKELQDKLDDILIRASIQSKLAGDKPGTIPGDIELYINGLLNPQVPWYQILRRFMTRAVKTNYTWRRPNRRYFPRYHLPTMYSQKLCDIAVAVDISGSVTDHQFHHFVSEVYAILKGHKPDNLKLLQFDTAIKSVDDIRSTRDLKSVQFKGRGGTSIEPVIEWATENKPHLLVIFTDGHFRNSLSDPGLPVVWIINDNPAYQAPWGKTIHFTTR